MVSILRVVGTHAAGGRTIHGARINAAAAKKNYTKTEPQYFGQAARLCWLNRTVDW
jgi:hypothetical protein